MTRLVWQRLPFPDRERWHAVVPDTDSAAAYQVNEAATEFFVVYFAGRLAAGELIGTADSADAGKAIAAHHSEETTT